MQIFSNPDRDISTPKPTPGSYEWWYFDAISVDNQYSLVIIFYEGNPFSRRYIDAIERKENDSAGSYPAISISVYKHGEPIFYSFEEILPEDAEFSGATPYGRIKQNEFRRASTGPLLNTYRLELNQTMPNGDSLKGELTFESRNDGPFSHASDENGEESKFLHQWNLIQPSAAVSGDLMIDGLHQESITFKGTGYHDHNTGMEPMKESFRDWYWGRFHFSSYTLVYYLMNEDHRRSDCAWLIDSENSVTELNGEFKLSDIGLNLFGLKSARKIEMATADSSFLIQQESTFDDGPFYQRFDSRLIVKLDGELHQARGISEYICPERIYMKIFWPLVNMRIQYPGKTHWVQKSPRLYRWTW
jgi:carotenoid 1,2-hydratase